MKSTDLRDYSLWVHRYINIFLYNIQSLDKLSSAALQKQIPILFFLSSVVHAAPVRRRKQN